MAETQRLAQRQLQHLLRSRCERDLTLPGPVSRAGRSSSSRSRARSAVTPSEFNARLASLSGSASKPSSSCSVPTWACPSSRAVFCAVRITSRADSVEPFEHRRQACHRRRCRPKPPPRTPVGVWYGSALLCRRPIIETGTRRRSPMTDFGHSGYADGDGRPLATLRRPGRRLDEAKLLVSLDVLGGMRAVLDVSLTRQRSLPVPAFSWISGVRFDARKVLRPRLPWTFAGSRVSRRLRYVVGAVTIVGLLCGLALMAPGAALAVAPLTWSAPVAIVHDPPGSAGGNELGAISCPSITFCAATDAFGSVVTSQHPAAGPTAWSAAPIDAIGLRDISCAAISLCVAVDAEPSILVATRTIGHAARWRRTPLALPTSGANSPRPSACPVHPDRFALSSATSPYATRHPFTGAKPALDSLRPPTIPRAARERGQSSRYHRHAPPWPPFRVHRGSFASRLTRTERLRQRRDPRQGRPHGVPSPRIRTGRSLSLARRSHSASPRLTTATS